MKWLNIFLPTLTLFFCLWSALLARLKGYSAMCWLLGGGLVGVALLCWLPMAGPGQLENGRRGNRLGLFLSTLSILVLFLWWAKPIR